MRRIFRIPAVQELLYTNSGEKSRAFPDFFQSILYFLFDSLDFSLILSLSHISFTESGDENIGEFGGYFVQKSHQTADSHKEKVPKQCIRLLRDFQLLVQIMIYHAERNQRSCIQHEKIFFLQNRVIRSQRRSTIYHERSRLLQNSISA